MFFRHTTINAMLMALLLTLLPSLVLAARVAVMPVEDLSKGSNGLNVAISQQLSAALAEQGYDVAAGQEVIAFMVRHRVRWLGHLGASFIRQLHEELGADYLILGSVNQRRDKAPFSLGLTVQVVRASDLQVVWARSAELSAADEVGILGLGATASMEEFESLVVQEALSRLAEELAEVQRPFRPHDGIDSVQLRPQIVQPGGKVFCRIKLESLPENLYGTTVSIFVDERIIAAEYRPEENSFVASWEAALLSDQYPVTVAVARPGKMEKEYLVGSYLVDGEYPEFDLQVKGQELNGMVVLQRHVSIMPILNKPEPIQRWVMTVRDSQGTIIMGDDGRGNLPDRFSWWGQGKSGGLVADGDYTVDLTVWDRAGNMASAAEDIRVIRRVPTMQVAMEARGDKQVALKVDYDGDIPLAYWRLEIEDENGALISEKSGTEGTDDVLLPLAALSNKKINYRLYAQDMLGNKLRQESTPLVPPTPEVDGDDGDFLAVAEEEGKVAMGAIWAEDF